VTLDLSEPELRSLERYLGVAQDATSGGFSKVVVVAGGAPGRFMTWHEAMTYAQEIGGRLATARELISVASSGREFFRSVPGVHSFWTADSSADLSHAAVVMPARGDIFSRPVGQNQGVLVIRTVRCEQAKPAKRASPGLVAETTN